MNEVEIKKCLRATIPRSPHGLIIEELHLRCHAARADIALIEETLRGFEIKSECDKLVRLEKQVSIYDQVFEFSTLVVSDKHYVAAKRIVPDYWGLTVVLQNQRILVTEREPQQSPMLCGLSIAELLWTGELLEIAVQNDWRDIRKSWSRRKLRQYLADNLSTSDLAQAASQKMKARQRWRAA